MYGILMFWGKKNNLETVFSILCTKKTTLNLAVSKRVSLPSLKIK
jgi:hypothetical protein